MPYETMASLNNIGLFEPAVVQHQAARPYMNLMETRQVARLACLPKGEGAMCVQKREDQNPANQHRVLIIDDNPDLLYVIEDLVSLLGYEAETAQTATG